MQNTIRWSLVVSKETDASLRVFLAQRGTRKGDLSKFVEEAVRWRVLDQTVAKTKKQNARVSGQEIESAITEAVHATHRHPTKRKF